LADLIAYEDSLSDANFTGGECLNESHKGDLLRFVVTLPFTVQYLLAMYLLHC